MQKNASKFKYEQNGEIEISSIKSKWVSFGMEYKTVPGMVEQTIYFIPFKKFVFIVFCIVPFGYLHDYQPAINKVIESIKIF